MAHENIALDYNKVYVDFVGVVRVILMVPCVLLLLMPFRGLDLSSTYIDKFILSKL